MTGKKTALIILDGWGHGDKTKSDAIYHANTPFIDSLYEKYPNCELLTDGENVGLPKGQMGNSEVGHLNIGAGRIVYHDLTKINVEMNTRNPATANIQIVPARSPIKPHSGGPINIPMLPADRYKLIALLVCSG